MPDTGHIPLFAPSLYRGIRSQVGIYNPAIDSRASVTPLFFESLSEEWPGSARNRAERTPRSRSNRLESGL